MTASTWSWRGSANVLLVAAVAVGIGAALGYLIGHEPAPAVEAAPPPRLTATNAELAILTPLREGSALGGFNVAEIRRIGSRGVLEIVLRRAETTVRLEVAIAVDGGPLPPAAAGPYAVFYAADKAAPGDAEALASALATVLRGNAGAPAPTGLRPFSPSP